MSADEEQETFVRRRLDEDDDEDNDDESEEEIGSSNTYGNRMMRDDDEEQDEEIDEATDDELLDEIKIEQKLQEELDNLMLKLENDLRSNGTLSDTDTFNKTEYILHPMFNKYRNIGSKQDTYQMPGADLEIDPDAQLTTFQENVITTGSSASVVLLVILIIMFIVQFIRKVYEHFQKQRIENSIDSVLAEAEEERAEDLSMKPTAFARYNTPFDERDEYEREERNGAELQILQGILEKRAIRVILRGTKLQEDGPGIRKNWQLDMVPKDVWDDFCLAEVNVKKEFESILQENEFKQFDWGQKHGRNVLQYAKEKIQIKRHQQMMNIKRNPHLAQQMAQNPALQRQAPRASSMLQPTNYQNNNSNNNTTRAPSARNFGNGLNTGYFNNQRRGQGPQKPGQRPPQKEKLTRRQKKKLKQQQGEGGAQGQQQQQQPTDPNVYNPGGNEYNPQQQGQQTNPQQRRKKGKRRMK